MASFSIASPPVPFAFDVDVHAGDKVISLGTLTSGREVVSQGINAMFGGGGETRTAIAMVPKLKAKSVTLVFTPNVSLAKRTLDLTSLYGGKVVIEDVEVTTNDMNR